MISFLSYFFLFCIPILLILIVNIKRKQRIIYSHTLLRNFQDESIMDFLFRYFHLYFDIIFDLLIAIALSLFLSGLLPAAARKNAVCIDGSYSMILSLEGKTPLDRAVGLIFEGNRLPKKYDLFILAFNPSRGQAEIYPLRGLKKLDSGTRAMEMLTNGFTFFNQELKRLDALFRKGYKRVIFITDSFPYSNTNLEVLEVGRERSGFFYPLSVKHDFTLKSTEISFYRHACNDEIGIEIFNKEKGNFEALIVPKNQIYAYDNHITVTLTEKELHRVYGQKMDFVFNLEGTMIGASAVGGYSKLLLEVLPQLEEGGENVLLADIEYGSQAGLRKLNKKINSFGDYDTKAVTLIPKRTEKSAYENYIHPLESSLSTPCLTEFPESLFALNPNSDTTIFYQNPIAIQDNYTPIVYLSCLVKDFPPAFVTSLKQKTHLIASGITSYVYEKNGKYTALNLCPDELFDFSARGELVFTIERLKCLPIFIILLLLYSLKIAFLYYLNRGRYRPE